MPKAHAPSLRALRGAAYNNLIAALRKAEREKNRFGTCPQETLDSVVKLRQYWADLKDVEA